uniref:Uncharacterized protein n=1 Tax=Acrobeloides nanus TaxID=290746 RepID=A0A914C3F9_9BILA
MANGKRGLHIFEENADEVTEFLQKKSITASKEGYIIIMPKGSKTCFPIILNVNQIMNIHQDDNIYGDAGHNLLLEARQVLKKDIIELDKREQK